MTAESPVEEEALMTTAAPIRAEMEDYGNKYDLATQFVQEHGVGTLEQGVAQLIKDSDDPDYNFTNDETNMLRAFQDALRDFQTQSEQSTETVKSENVVDDETVENRTSL